MHFAPILIGFYYQRILGIFTGIVEKNRGATHKTLPLCSFFSILLLLLVAFEAGALHPLAHDDAESMVAHHHPNTNRASLVDQIVNL